MYVTLLFLWLELQLPKSNIIVMLRLPPTSLRLCEHNCSLFHNLMTMVIATILHNFLKSPLLYVSLLSSTSVFTFIDTSFLICPFLYSRIWRAYPNSNFIFLLLACIPIVFTSIKWFPSRKPCAPCDIGHFHDKLCQTLYHFGSFISCNGGGYSNLFLCSSSFGLYLFL